MKEDRAREAKALKFVAVLGLVCLLMMIFPFYSIANRAEPFVMGLPFSMFWVVLWILVEFVGFIVAYNWEYRGR
ncbi:MAG TPA: hypothetical protein GXX23_09175 [Firmicutes bacterium]|nr:hypothetical protein [Candidatus Fermentithermobacillaceae bacterium]